MNDNVHRLPFVHKITRDGIEATIHRDPATGMFFWVMEYTVEYCGECKTLREAIDACNHQLDKVPPEHFTKEE